jgi:hypothetical protein
MLPTWMAVILGVIAGSSLTMIALTSRTRFGETARGLCHLSSASDSRMFVVTVPGEDGTSPRSFLVLYPPPRSSPSSPSLEATPGGKRSTYSGHLS